MAVNNAECSSSGVFRAELWFVGTYHAPAVRWGDSVAVVRLWRAPRMSMVVNRRDGFLGHFGRCSDSSYRIAHTYLYEILHGRFIHFSDGAVTSFDSNMASWFDPGELPAPLINSQDPNIVCLAMRALARSGFVSEHAQLLIDKLDHENEQIRAYALVALAEMTGVYRGTDKSQWQAWLGQYRKYRRDLDTRGHYRLFASMCRIARKEELSPDTIEQVMAAWQGGSTGSLRFRKTLSSEQGTETWHLLASIKIEGDNPIQYGHTRGYWMGDMFRAAGHRNHDLKIQFERKCKLDEKTFEPGKWYVLPSLFRDGYQGKWEIVDVRLEDIQ